MPALPQPGPPLETMPDPLEAQLNIMDWNMQDMYARVSRSEEAYAAVTSKCQALLDGLVKCHQWNSELSTHLLTLVPDPDNPVHRDVYTMRQEISRQVDNLRTLEDVQESPVANKQSYFQNTGSVFESAMPTSPHQRLYDESRRPSLQAGPRPSSYRAAVPTHLQVSPRRYGSIGSGNTAYSPSSSRPNYPPPPPPPAQPQPQHPLATQQSPPGLPRRHTSADIRLQGWQGGQPPPSYTHGSSPYASGANSTAWPSSPRFNANQGDQQIRDALASYELQPRTSNVNSRQPSPPPTQDSGVPSFSASFGSNNYANSNDAGWQLPGARFPFRGIDTAPPTRRSSMASNVHNLLNPADTAEREREDEGGPDERKRKRVL